MQTDAVIQTFYTIDLIFYLQNNKIFDCFFLYTRSNYKVLFSKMKYAYYRKLQIHKYLLSYVTSFVGNINQKVFYKLLKFKPNT